MSETGLRAVRAGLEREELAKLPMDVLHECARQDDVTRDLERLFGVPGTEKMLRLLEGMTGAVAGYSEGLTEGHDLARAESNKMRAAIVYLKKELDVLSGHLVG